jgi:two-component system, OmpR family, sensor kinase
MPGHRHRGGPPWAHHHHRGPPWRRSPLGPVGRFVRARLRRRIFAWFSAGLVSTGALVAVVMVLVGKVQEPQWARTMENGKGWVGRQFGKVWRDPAAREAYARETARELEASVELDDAAGQALLRVGPPCRHHGSLEAPVTDGVSALGTARICFAHPPTWGGPWVLLAVAGVAAVWMASGRVARRLARPLDELSEVVKKLGSGDLSARASLSCQQPDEIGLVAEAVNDMAARIEKLLAEERELLATVSHELRTPLARVRIISELAREGGATARTYDDLDREVVEMDALVGELLASSRLQFGQMVRRPLSLRDLATRALERAGLPPEVLTVEGEGDALTGDPTLLQRALANLFDNARKHAGGADAFRVSREGDRVRFEVLDRGPGLPGEPGALFLKFRKGEGGADSGLGLGLALVKRIAEAHGGTVLARDREGGGAVFGFEVAA